MTHEKILEILSKAVGETDCGDCDVTDVSYAVALRATSCELYDILIALRNEWKIVDEEEIRTSALRSLYKITPDYAKEITDKILPDIVEDVSVSASVDWNNDDVNLAIGRVLCKKLGIEC